MRVCRSTYDAPSVLVKTGSVVVIGNFDGIHLGHRTLISQARSFADRLRLPLCVLTFDPTATVFFSRKLSKPEPLRIQNFYDKMQLLQEIGVDYTFSLKFNEALGNLSALEFLNLLTEHLGAKYFCVGHDFQFGKNRQGDIAFIQQYTQEHDQLIFVLPEIIDPISKQRISSSYIRELLSTGNLDEASRLLGRTYSLSGKVGHGLHLGTELGFPTANLCLSRHCIPIGGVFAVRVTTINNQDVDLLGVANIGTNPTINKDLPKTLEVHILDYSGDLYGKRIQIEFIGRLREEKKFADLDELCSEIKRDILNAREMFSERKAG